MRNHCTFTISFFVGHDCGATEQQMASNWGLASQRARLGIRGQVDRSNCCCGAVIYFGETVEIAVEKNGVEERFSFYRTEPPRRTLDRGKEKRILELKSQLVI